MKKKFGESCQVTWKFGLSIDTKSQVIFSF